MAFLHVKSINYQLKTMNKMSYQVSEKGYYGDFGGAYIPEMLYPNVEGLRATYLDIINEPSFKKEFDQLLKDYVGRPSPLYYAKRLSEKYDTKVYYWLLKNLVKIEL